MDNYGRQIDAHTVRFERLLPGPIERVRDYLTDSTKRGEWFAAGVMPQKAGEKFEIVFDHDKLSPNKAAPPEKYKDMKFSVSSHHKLLKIEKPHLLVFDWDGETANASEVEFRLEPRGDKVRLILTHRKLANRNDMTNVSGGWHSHLAILEDRLHGRVPPSIWIKFSETEAEYEKRIAQ